ncbi:hypothetical protein IJ541_04680 [bacterium]|nr:hypothetical protein [bacterium]
MKVEQNYQQLNIKQIQPKCENKITQNKVSYKSNPNFTGWVDMGLRFLDTNPAWGADVVDLCFMVTPRTLTDFGRGADAGIETMRREGMGTANHSAVPLYGTLAGLAFAMGINGLYGLNEKGKVKASSVFADSETLDMMGKIYDKELKYAQSKPGANPLRSFLTKYFGSYEALSPSENAKYIKADDLDIKRVVDILEQEIKADGNKPAKDAMATARAIITSSLGGAENNLRIIANDGEKLHTSRYTVDTIIENAYKLGKIFTTEKVKEAFISAEHYTENAFINAMKSMNMKRSLAGIGIASAVGVSTQPLNMYLTKKKTGKSGFVGGGEEDKSTGFKLKKLAAGLAFLAGVFSTIENPKKLIKEPKSLINALQFKGFNPTIKQFKFIYGITIFSRFLSSRNDNELKETSIKDTLGFINWLILGNFVQKLVAQGLDKDLIKKDGDGIMKWITGSVLKSRDEILHASLGKKVFKNGKALSYNEMVKLADKATKIKLRKLSIAQIINYAYSGLVLGVGIPKLNIYLTGRREAKKAERLAKSGQQPQTQNGVISSTGALKNEDIMLAPANIRFLNKTGVDFLNN